MAPYKKFPLIETNGSPYEIGYEHGLKAREQIEVNLKTCRDMIKDYSNIDWASAKKLALSFKDPIKEYNPKLLQEIEGIAAGADKDLSEILALNSSREMILTGGSIDGCTSVAVGPELTATQETFIAQNWDWRPTQKEAVVILKIKQLDGPEILMVTEAGIIGKIGFNSAGLGVCMNGLVTDQKHEGTPLHVVAREALNAVTIRDAINAIAKTKAASSLNIMVAHSAGEVVTIEVTPNDFDVIYGDNGFVCHTNHFISNRLVGTKDLSKRIFPDTFIRYGRINKKIKALKETVTEKALQEIFKDHVEFPNSICRHEDTNSDINIMQTNLSIIMNLDKGEMHLSAGTPCSFPYERYGF